MTFDQLVHLLAVLAWPAVAVIAGSAFVHGCRLLVEGAGDLAGTLDRRIPQALGTWLRVTSRKAGPSPVLHENDRLTETCERAFLAILAANGGIPARQSDDAARMLVREVRKMYAEIENPTVAPAPGPSADMDRDPFAFELEPGTDEDEADRLYATFQRDPEDLDVAGLGGSYGERED